jgi:hypothetical protein
MSKRTDASSPSAGKFATGTYIGNNAATQAIVGVGFQPKFLIIYRQDEVTINTPGWKTDTAGVSCKYCIDSNFYWAVDDIISLDADGFTVGDNTPWANVFNDLGVNYTYVAFG